jgi:hypothetical protein
MTIYPLRGFGLGAEIGGLISWIVLFFYVPMIIQFYGFVEKPAIARGVARSLIFVVIALLGGLITGTALNMHIHVVTSPATVVTLLIGIFCMAIAIPAIVYLRTVPPLKGRKYDNPRTRRRRHPES